MNMNKETLWHREVREEVTRRMEQVIPEVRACLKNIDYRGLHLRWGIERGYLERSLLEEREKAFAREYKPRQILKTSYSALFINERVHVYRELLEYDARDSGRPSGTYGFYENFELGDGSGSGLHIFRMADDHTLDEISAGMRQAQDEERIYTLDKGMVQLFTTLLRTPCESHLKNETFHKLWRA